MDKPMKGLVTGQGVYIKDDFVTQHRCALYQNTPLEVNKQDSKHTMDKPMKVVVTGQGV